MIMNVTVQPPMHLLREAVNKQIEVDCERCQAVFDLFPPGYIQDQSGWRLEFVCGTNHGIGSETGYGVGFHCTPNCKHRIPLDHGTLFWKRK
jgi:hypothetical protein